MNETPQLPDSVKENIAFLFKHEFRYAYDKRVPELQSDGTIVIRDNQTGQGFDPSTGKKVFN